MNKKALLYFILASFFIGAFVVVNKAGLNSGLNPLSFVLSATLVSGFLGFLYLTPKIKLLKKIGKREWMYIVLAGLITVGIVLILQYLGQSYTTAINASFLLTLTAISTPLFSYFMVGERIPKIQWIFVLIIIGGVFLLTTNGKLNTFNVGDSLILAGVFLLGFSNTLSKMAMKNTTGDIVASFRLLIGSMFLVILIPFLLSNPFNAFSLGFQYVIFSGILMFAASVFFLKGMELSSPSIAAITITLQPIFSTILAYLFLKDVLSITQTVGAFLIIIGLYFFATPKQKPYKTSKKPE